jgi:hypothetical protein
MFWTLHDKNFGRSAEVRVGVDGILDQRSKVRLSELFPRFHLSRYLSFALPGRRRLPRRRRPLLSPRLQTTFFTTPHSFQQFSPPRTRSLTGSSARFLTNRIDNPIPFSTQPPQHIVFVIHIYFSTSKQPWSDVRTLSTIHSAILAVDVVCSLTFCLCTASRLHRLPQRLDYTLIPAPLG